MEQKKDLWELVRQKLEKNNEPVIESPNNEEPKNLIKKEIDTVRKDKKERSSLTLSVEKEKSNLNNDRIIFLNQGIFAGFIYILTIMIVLGILMIPGSITAAIGGYFGGRKSGDPARALTAAMLPFLIIASISVMGSIGALPPGSGPNDLSDSISDFLGYNPGDEVLGPLSKMPDSNSSVFLSLVAFGFIGGLVEIDRKKKMQLD
ncbi:7TM-DISM domain-containing protein [Marine Group III euryarchaeote]|nr:7TM-DISM domain-containing protein [Marine Group III euryarchaeote]